MRTLLLTLATLVGTATLAVAGAELRPRDLTPVKWMKAPKHAPVEIVRDGQPRAVIYVADPRGKLRYDPQRHAPGRYRGIYADLTLPRLIRELVEVIRLSTGATLQVVDQPPPAEQPAIVIGDCDEARRAGIDASRIEIEGFVVATAANRVFLVGSSRSLPPGSDPWAWWSNQGTAWAVADFLERFVGVRWYWPAELGGRSIVRARSLVIPPVRYSDHPVFRMRMFHPLVGWKLPTKARWFDKEPLPFPPGAIPEGVGRIDMWAYLPLVRYGNSWPYQIKVHEPQRLWRKGTAWLEANKEMFALKKDGTRNFSMLCYSSPKTLDYLLKGCEERWDGRDYPDVFPSWVTATCVTVSPADLPYDCHCPACRATMAKGGASLLVGLFVKRVCEEVKKRWPGKKVIYLPYWNYQKCPEAVDFPDNLEVQLCTTGGPMALMRQPGARRATETNLRAWSAKLAGRPITLWDYSDRGSGWTYGPVQYPHIVCDFYRANRDHVAGVFINGGVASDWTTSAPTLYIWMKALWNPDLDVDAVLDEMCRRLYGKAAETARELLRLECERWESAPWSRGLEDAGRIPPKLFRDIWPADVVARMKALRDKALAQLADDPVARQRFLYWTWTFDAFVEDAERIDRRQAPR